jgi:hypothetical protein
MTFRKRKGGFQKKGFKETSASKKKGKYFNCGKERHFARECRFSKINSAKFDNVKKKKGAERLDKSPNLINRGRFLAAEIPTKSSLLWLD